MSVKRFIVNLYRFPRRPRRTGVFTTWGCWSNNDISTVIAQLPSMLIARAATVTIVTRETVLSNIISILAREVSGRTSVGLNAVAVQNARNRESTKVGCKSGGTCSSAPSWGNSQSNFVLVRFARLSGPPRSIRLTAPRAEESRACTASRGRRITARNAGRSRPRRVFLHPLSCDRRIVTGRPCRHSVSASKPEA
jgi:hypothetical protein